MSLVGGRVDWVTQPEFRVSVLFQPEGEVMPTTLLLALRIWKPNDISVKYPNFGVFFQIFMRKPKPKLKVSVHCNLCTKIYQLWKWQNYWFSLLSILLWFKIHRLKQPGIKLCFLGAQSATCLFWRLAKNRPSRKVQRRIIWQTSWKIYKCVGHDVSTRLI